MNIKLELIRGSRANFQLVDNLASLKTVFLCTHNRSLSQDRIIIFYDYLQQFDSLIDDHVSFPLRRRRNEAAGDDGAARQER